MPDRYCIKTEGYGKWHQDMIGSKSEIPSRHGMFVRGEIVISNSTPLHNIVSFFSNPCSTQVHHYIAAQRGKKSTKKIFKVRRGKIGNTE